MKTKIRIAGVVLAGGKSSRFGSDKSQLIVKGKPLVQLQLEKLAKAGCAPLFIVGCSGASMKRRSSLPTSALHRSAATPVAEMIRDLHPNLGPIGGLHAALLAIQPRKSFAATTDAIFLLACDMPLITAKTMRKIIAAFEPHLDAVVPIHDGNLEPLCALYSRRVLPAIERRIAARKLAMHDLVKSLTTKYLDVSKLANCDREFYNVNTKEDYQQIRRKP